MKPIRFDSHVNRFLCLHNKFLYRNADGKSVHLMYSLVLLEVFAPLFLSQSSSLWFFSAAVSILFYFSMPAFRVHWIDCAKLRSAIDWIAHNFVGIRADNRNFLLTQLLCVRTCVCVTQRFHYFLFYFSIWMKNNMKIIFHSIYILDG